MEEADPDNSMVRGRFVNFGLEKLHEKQTHIYKIKSSSS